MQCFSFLSSEKKGLYMMIFISYKIYIAQIKMDILNIIISNPLSDTDNIQHKMIGYKRGM